jgi:hypothetical protein
MAILLRVVLACSILIFAIPQKETAGRKKGPVRIEELLALIAKTDTVVVYTSYTDTVGRILYASSHRNDISALGAAISIIKPDPEFICVCMTSPEVVLYRRGKVLASVGVLPEGVIRSSLWDSDATIQDMEKWLRWFDDRNINSPRKNYERDIAVGEADRTLEERWIAAMPEGLRPIWPKVMDQMMLAGIPQPPDTKPLEEELAQEIPDDSARIRALMSWYGTGAGPWSGYPIYEDVAEEMLLEYSTSQLLKALDGVTLTELETEGAARLFASWEFRRRRPDDNAMIPGRLKMQLLDHLFKSSDSDKLERARAAFE